MIVGHIHGQVLSITNNPIVSDTINYLSAKFSFTDDWQGLVKFCHFSQGSTVYDVMLENDCIASTAGLALATGEWSVYLHGNLTVNGTVQKRITTTVASFTIDKSGVLNGVPLPTLTASAGEQILARVEQYKENNKIITDALQVNITNLSTTIQNVDTYVKSRLDGIDDLLANLRSGLAKLQQYESRIAELERKVAVLDGNITFVFDAGNSTN